MARAEFSKPTRRDALKRSGGFCEAVGDMYGLPSGQRCYFTLSNGVEFDHIILDANSKDSSLENCAAVCIKCHDWKTRHVDIPTAAKTVRQMEKNIGGVGRRSSRPFPGGRQSKWRRKMNGEVVAR